MSFVRYKNAEFYKKIFLNCGLIFLKNCNFHMSFTCIYPSETCCSEMLTILARFSDFLYFKTVLSFITIMKISLSKKAIFFSSAEQLLEETWHLSSALALPVFFEHPRLRLLLHPLHLLQGRIRCHFAQWSREGSGTH